MKEEYYLKKVEAYIRDQMTKSERLAFEKELKEDSRLLQIKKKYELAAEAVDQLSEKALSENIQKWIKEESISHQNATDLEAAKISTSTTDNKSSKRNWLRPIGRLALAASTILILTFFWFKYAPLNQSNQTQLANSYFESLDIPNFRSNESELSNRLSHLYEEKNYQAVIRLLLEQQSLSDKNAYLLAHCHFKSKDYSSAEKQYKILMAWNNSSYKEESEWGFLLTLLAQNKLDQEFYLLLNRISTDNYHSFYQKAIELKDSIATAE